MTTTMRRTVAPLPTLQPPSPLPLPHCCYYYCNHRRPSYQLFRCTASAQEVAAVAAAQQHGSKA
jgi:hypothetical protein